ncbi:hypothetical protein FT639_31015 [Bacillus mycoides]|nr:hypothetical protein [Bacillus mycoides]
MKYYSRYIFRKKSIQKKQHSLYLGVTIHAHQLKNGNKMNFRSNKLQHSYNTFYSLKMSMLNKPR